MDVREIKDEREGERGVRARRREEITICTNLFNSKDKDVPPNREENSNMIIFSLFSGIKIGI